jgi:cytochrome c biogenesis protein CcdA
MRKISLICILATVLVANTSLNATSARLTVDFFGSRSCGDCLEIKEVLLKPLAAKYPDKLDIKLHDFEEPSVMQQLLTMEKRYGITKSSPQELFVADTFLTGYEDIINHGQELIVRVMKQPQRWNSASSTASTDTLDAAAFLKEQSGSRAFFLGTLVAGLTDGINPCAIATMIFLISFLATQKRKRSEILTIGLAYTATVYVTYFGMGIGLFRILDSLKDKHLISSLIRWGACAVALTVSVLSFRDAWVFGRTKRVDSISLQLPKSVKMRIHKVITGNLSGTSLLLGATVTGFLVTLLEAICTGQMYLPYIVAMTRRDALRTTGLAYLAFYNLLFVLPLLVVMVLAYYGMKWNALAKKTQNNMVTLKTVLGVVMLSLALYLALAG